MNCYRLSMIVASVALILCAVRSTAQPAGGTLLTYKLTEGKTYRYRTQMDIESIQTMMDMEMTTTTRMTAFAHMTIENVDVDGDITFVSAADSLIVDMHSPRRDTVMVNPFGIVGKRTRVVATKFGRLISSTPLDTIRFPMRMGRIRSTASVSLMEFGDRPIELGDTWDHTRIDTVEQMGGEMVTTTDLTFTAVEMTEKLGHDCFKIVYEGSASLEGSGSMRGMNTFIEGTGAVTGTAYFAPAEGLLVQSERTTDQEMTVAVTGQQSMTIPISQSITLATTLVE